MSTEIRVVVPRSALRPSPFNPRKTFDPAGLQELADSFGTHGVLQPLLVRPVGAKVKWDAKKGVSGYDHFEVVCGHRRLAAAELGNVPELPVTIRALTDQEAREIQLIENAQRADVPPSEEAAAVRELVALVGLEKAAGRTGLPLARVRDLVRLAALPAWFLAAVDRRDIPVSTAAIVAKVPGEESREKAAGCVALCLYHPGGLDSWTTDKRHWRDQAAVAAAPMSSREAKYLVSTYFSRQLKAVPFSRKSLDLVPEAGSCDACPKRAGNDPELSAEGVRADVCTDPDCCDRKLAAYREQELAKAAKKHGATPADDVSWERWQEYPKGWCLLDMPVGRSELNDPRNPWRGKKAEQTVGELLQSATFAGGKHVAFDPKTGKPVLLVRTKDARRALEAAGLLDKPERVKREAKSAATVKREAVAHAEDDAGPFLLYRVTLNPAALPAVEFDALDGTSEEGLREQAASAFMDWFDTVDWTAPGPQLLAYERVPEAEAAVLTPPVEQDEAVETQAEPAPALDAIDEPGETEHPKGEPIEALGVLLEDLQAVTHLCSTNTQTVAVKPVVVNGGKYVASGSGTGPWNRWKTWDLLPLHTESEFADRYPDVPRRVKEGFPDGDRNHPAGFYGGLQVFTGRGRHVERWVVGVKGEQRRLLWLNPKAPDVRTPAPPPDPVVCAPVGSARLRDVPKFPGVVAGVLESVGVETLSDLDRRSDECRRQHRDTGATPHNLLRTVEAEFGIQFKFNELMAAGDALLDHLVVKPAPEPKAKKKGKVKA